MAARTPITISATIQPGSVYFFADEELPSPHFFVVINKNPAVEHPILLLYVSSQVEKIVSSRSLWRSKTVVIIKKGTHPDFSLDSAIDCNHVFSRSIKDLERKFKSGHLRIKSAMSSNLLDKLRESVLESDVVEEYIKDMIR
ncbi:MAG: hypothetical protein A2W25_17510 [candidate division Zixibacteria bacterium RBG_16_53_22]|nr:MAG: hypothetical protein A2W25_17510 [candidate division Zixibacteria bacterium RBG_16_53_22]